jgi:hypothetical protein
MFFTGSASEKEESEGAESERTVFRVDFKSFTLPALPGRFLVLFMPVIIKERAITRKKEKI